MDAFKTAQALEPSAEREKVGGFVLFVGSGPEVIEVGLDREVAVERAVEILNENETVVFLLSQLSRKSEGPWAQVTLGMARDSGHIEQDSDFIIAVWDPWLQEGAGEEWVDKIMLKLIKNKRGMTKGIECRRDRSTGKLYELEIERG